MPGAFDDTQRIVKEIFGDPTFAARHNLSQFLLSLYASLREGATPEVQARMLPGVTAALKTLD